MLIKETCLHPGPLQSVMQSVMVDMVVAEVMVDDMVVVEAVVVVENVGGAGEECVPSHTERRNLYSL